MSEPDPFAFDLMGALRQAQAQLLEAARPPRFEYEQVPWEQVNEYARDGWMLAPVIGPIPDVQSKAWLFIMQRQLGAADEAADMLKEAGQ